MSVVDIQTGWTEAINDGPTKTFNGDVFYSTVRADNFAEIPMSPVQKDLCSALNKAGRPLMAQFVRQEEIDEMAKRWKKSGDRRLVNLGFRVKAMHRLLPPDQFWSEVGVILGVFEREKTT